MTQKAAASKWTAANAKVNADCTEKQSITLDSEKKDQSVANNDKQTSKDEGLYPVAMGKCSTEYSSIKGTGQTKQICSRLTQKQEEYSVFLKPVTEPCPVLACDSSD